MTFAGVIASVAIVAVEIIAIHSARHPKETSKVQWHLKHGYIDYLD